MKNVISCISLCLLFFSGFTQSSLTITINDCYSLAKQNYPLSGQTNLLEKSRKYSIENASKGYYPQLNFNGQATYQSDVTQVPIKLPTMEITPISKDQYKIYGEVNQVLFDGGFIKAQKKSILANADTETQQLEVELYKLRERIAQLFFGILLIEEQINQTNLAEKDLQAGLLKVNALVDNGAALKSTADNLQVEILKNDQRQIELKASRKAWLEMLGFFINQPLTEITVLQKPSPVLNSSKINRPELLLFESQKKGIETQKKAIVARNLPKASFFIHGGYARPALNMLDNKFDFYYLGGVRLNWSLSGFYTSKKEKINLNIKQQIIDLQKETFSFNTTLVLKQQAEDESKLAKLIETDKEIISLQIKIKNTALAQLENGTLTSSDYIREVNATDRARQNLTLHEIQLLMSQYNQQIVSGN
jgi:outer membrane protein TolC